MLTLNFFLILMIWWCVEGSVYVHVYAHVFMYVCMYVLIVLFSYNIFWSCFFLPPLLPHPTHLLSLLSPCSLFFLTLSISTHSLKNKMKIKTKKNTGTNKTKNISRKIDKNQKSSLHLLPQKIKQEFALAI